MKAKAGLPERVRSNEGLGVTLCWRHALELHLFERAMHLAHSHECVAEEDL